MLSSIENSDLVTCMELYYSNNPALVVCVTFDFVLTKHFLQPQDIALDVMCAENGLSRNSDRYLLPVSYTYLSIYQTRIILGDQSTRQPFGEII